VPAAWTGDSIRDIGGADAGCSVVRAIRTRQPLPSRARTVRGVKQRGAPTDRSWGREKSAAPVTASYEDDYYSSLESFAQPSVPRSIVWFRVGDLRLRDHPGLFSAGESTRESIVPLFIVTPLTPLDEILQILDALRRGLRARRADLIVRFAESELKGLVDFVTSEYSCDAVHVHCDSNSRDVRIFEEIERQLTASSATAAGTGSGCRLLCWQDELRSFTQDKDSWSSNIPTCYPEFLRWDVRSKSNILPSTVDFEPAVLVPGLPKHVSIEAGSLDDILAMHVASKPVSSIGAILGRYQSDSRRVGVESFDEIAAICGNDEDVGEMFLNRLLLRLENYESVDIGRFLEPVMRFGLVSPRRVHEIVCTFERSQGRLFRPIYRSGAKTILSWLDAREFAICLANRDIKDGAITVDGNHRPKFWRWRGCLVRYVEEGSDAESGPNKPALLLVHGFGASAQHWGRNVFELSSRFHVFAVCMPGFGRAEKPPFIYTQAVWEAFLAEFVRDVVGRKAFVVGNSIGGYLSCAFASDGYPELCAGLALVNPAGKLVTSAEYEVMLLDDGVTKVARKSLLYWLASNFESARNTFGSLLLLILRRNISKTLQKAYPTVQISEYAELLKEIYRNSLDFGAVNVLSSSFILPPQRSINELLRAYEGPLLVMQGKFDALGNPLRRAELLKAAYPAAKIVILDAGHCPHDESPAVFNEALSSWMDEVLHVSHEEDPNTSETDLAVGISVLTEQD
jgi:pimeloyl-ACP methyl ester carboxylesterase